MAKIEITLIAIILSQKISCLIHLSSFSYTWENAHLVHLEKLAAIAKFHTK